MLIASLVSPTKVLKLGNSGPEVAALQLALKNIGYPLTGTDTAVTAFQKRAGVPADGDVGPTTAALIDAAQSIPMPASVTEEVSRPLWLEAGLKFVGLKEGAGTADNQTIINWAKDEGGDIAAEYTH